LPSLPGVLGEDSPRRIHRSSEQPIQRKRPHRKDAADSHFRTLTDFTILISTS
jgi:hypothetical protein